MKLLTLLVLALTHTPLQATRITSTLKMLTTLNPAKETPSRRKSEIEVDADISLYDALQKRNFTIASLGGRAASDPCCVASDTESTYCFIRDLDGFINYRSIEKDTHWMSLRQYAIGDVECVVQGNGDITVIVVDITNTMTVNTLQQTQWLGWRKTEATQLMEVPGCTARRHHLVNCMYRNQENEGVFISATDNNWEAPYRVDGFLLSPAACHGDDDTISCYSTNMRFHLQVVSWRLGGELRPWKQLGNYYMTVRPSVTTHGREAVDIFTVGPGSNLLWKRRNQWGQYLDWRKIDGYLGWRPECVGSRDRIDCYAISAMSQFMSNSWNGSRWTGWRDLRRGYVGKPSCHISISDADVISCFVRNARTVEIDNFDFQI